MKTILTSKVLVVVALIIVSGLAWVWKSNRSHVEGVLPVATTSPVTNVPNVFDPKNGTYTIDGQKVTLKNGISEVEAAPGSASKIITKYFGNEVRHDFDGDGREDVAFLITQSTGGSGTFYYVVTALNTVKGLVGSDAYLLGDRIAPQSTVMGKGNIVVVNYAERAKNESFAVAPHIGKSVWLLLDVKTMKWGEVVQNFEGEASTSKMNLKMKAWNWINTSYNNGTKITPVDSKKFSITFKDGGIFSATTDCNGLGGNYVVNGNKITFDKMISTQMFCEGSQEQDFQKTLSETQSYHFTSKGELIFDLKMDSGVAVFK